MTDETIINNFQVDLRGVVDLLSHHLYSSPRVFARELLQNGVDAITARRQLEPNAPQRITVEVQPGSLRVTDTGIGLTGAEMVQLLATVGRSSKRDEYRFARQEFLGQFGIGLLSCFMVADEIAVRSRSARTPDAETVLWQGRADGTYQIRTTDDVLAEPGTEVVLTARHDDLGWFDPTTVRQLLTSYGSLLPVAVDLVTADGTVSLTEPGRAPWQAGPDAAEAFCRSEFGFEPFDQIRLEVPLSGLQGVAFVLPTPVNPASPPNHRAYLKNMLLADGVSDLVPEWAFFVRCVINATDLRPTASREALYNDLLLEETREAIGRQIREWLLRLATISPGRMADFLSVHQLGVKAIAAHDDELLALVRDQVPFETSIGEVTLAEFRRTFPTVRYTRTVDDFRALSAVAAAHGYGLINAGYAFDQQILQRMAETDPEFDPAPMSAAELAARLEPLASADDLAARPFVRAVEDAIRARDCDIVLRRFDPSSLPALYLPDPDGAGRAVAQAAQDSADPLWAEILGAVADTSATGRSQFVLNYGNPLVRRLIALNRPELTARVAAGLYVQALLLGRHPLRPADTALLSSSYLGLVEWALDTSG